MESMDNNTDNLIPLQNSTLRERAKRVIRSSILTGEISSGEIYPTSFFSDKLGISATPIREAIFDLLSDGLIEQASRGFQVPVISKQDWEELIEVRVLLEIPTVVKLSDILKVEDLDELREIARKIDSSAAEEDIREYRKWDEFFHSNLIMKLGNTRLANTIQRLRDQSRLFRLRDKSGLGRLEIGAKQHHDILDALINRDKQKVEELMELHLSLRWIIAS